MLPTSPPPPMMLTFMILAPRIRPAVLGDASISRSEMSTIASRLGQPALARLFIT